MRVVRRSLPHPAKIATVPGELIILDVHLCRADASLAIMGLYPDVHVDVQDHWLDQCFERPLFMYGKSLRSLSAGLMLT